MAQSEHVNNEPILQGQGIEKTSGKLEVVQNWAQGPLLRSSGCFGWYTAFAASGKSNSSLKIAADAVEIQVPCDDKAAGLSEMRIDG